MVVWYVCVSSGTTVVTLIFQREVRWSSRKAQDESQVTRIVNSSSVTLSKTDGRTMLVSDHRFQQFLMCLLEFRCVVAELAKALLYIEEGSVCVGRCFLYTWILYVHESNHRLVGILLVVRIETFSPKHRRLLQPDVALMPSDERCNRQPTRQWVW